MSVIETSRTHTNLKREEKKRRRSTGWVEEWLRKRIPDSPKQLRHSSLYLSFPLMLRSISGLANMDKTHNLRGRPQVPDTSVQSAIYCISPFSGMVILILDSLSSVAPFIYCIFASERIDLHSSWFCRVTTTIQTRGRHRREIRRHSTLILRDTFAEEIIGI